MGKVADELEDKYNLEKPVVCCFNDCGFKPKYRPIIHFNPLDGSEGEAVSMINVGICEAHKDEPGFDVKEFVAINGLLFSQIFAAFRRARPDLENAWVTYETIDEAQEN